MVDWASGNPECGCSEEESAWWRHRELGELGELGELVLVRLKLVMEVGNLYVLVVVGQGRRELPRTCRVTRGGTCMHSLHMAITL